MGVKISSLPINTLPYSGGEKIPLVQGSETRAGTLSSFINYLSGSLGSSSSDTALRSLSGNWQSTYTTYSANSANYAVKNANNNFTNTQTISVVDTTKVKFGNFKAKIDTNTANIQFGYDSTDTTSGTYNISIGINANSSGDDNISIGRPATSADTFKGNDLYNISIGSNTLLNASPPTLTSNIMIGNGSAINTTSNANDNVIIGSNAGIAGSSVATSVVVGPNATSSFDNCVVLGNAAAPSEPNQLAFGYIDVFPGTGTQNYYMKVNISGTNYYILMSDTEPV